MNRNTEDQPAAVDRVAFLEQSLDVLRRHVDALHDRVRVLEIAAEPAPVLAAPGPPTPTTAASAAAGAAVLAPTTDSGSFWLHSGALRRIATISFVLVVALVLRTLTDGGVVDTAFGVWLGVGYALVLLAIGWRCFAVDRRGKRVFTICGALLLCSLVLETHGRFQYLSAATAHGLLIAALLASAVLGIRYGSAITVELGVLAASAAAIGLGFPRPLFPATAATLALAMVAAARARPRRIAWFPGSVFALLLFFWLLWAAKLRAVLVRGGGGEGELAGAWFVPALALTGSVLLAIAWRLRTRASGLFAFVLPSANVTLVFGAAAAVLVPSGLAPRWLGGLAVGVAALHALLAASAARTDRQGTSAAERFALAALVAFVPGVWFATGGLPLAPPIVGGAALGTAALSSYLRSGCLRALALGLQLATLGASIAGGGFAAPPAEPWRAAALGVVLTALLAVHYRWTQRVPPAPDTLYARLSPADWPGRGLFWAMLVALFCTLRVVVYPWLARLPGDATATFAAAQSVIVNAMAIVLMVVGLRGRRRAVLRCAFVVAAIGGGKVFASDFLTLRGVPLVVAVFSFGVVAAVGSVVQSRWHGSRGAAA